jgi:uncharacterized protein (DUF1697 family)
MSHGYVDSSTVRSVARENSYAALLRSVNVGGRKVSMADIRDLFGSLGYSDVATYVQSGNVVFKSSSAAATMTDSIESAVRTLAGFEVDVFIRSAKDLRTILKKHPFLDRTDDGTKLHVTFLSERPTKEKVSDLPTTKDSDELLVDGREIYLYCPNGYGNTKLNNAFLERKLSVRATTRNWKTVIKLVEMTG